MKYAKVRMVDAITDIPANEAPCRNGPKYPDLKGLKVLFANEGDWPIQKDGDDFYYISCDDDADLTIAGVVKVLTKTELDEAKVVEGEKLRPKMVEVVDNQIQSATAQRDSIEDITPTQLQKWNAYIAALEAAKNNPAFPWEIIVEAPHP